MALNLRFRTFAGLLHPLSYDQTMPIGLLLAFKTASRALGFSELALRFLPLVAGCALVILTWVLFSRVVNEQVAFLMLALISLSPSLIYYSTEVKQYGIDALVAMLVTWLGVRLLQGSTSQDWRWVTLGGAAGLLISHPVIFVLASIGAAAVADPRFRSSRDWRKLAAVAAVVWLALFLALYLVSYHATMHSAFMRLFWAPKFIHVGLPSFRSDRSAAVGLLLGEAEITRVPVLVLGGLFLLGVYAIAKKHGSPAMVLVAGPFVLLLLASALKFYPIAIRLVLFLLPLVYWILASGISRLSDLFPHKARDFAFLALAGIFVLPTFESSVWQARHFHSKEGTRDVVTRIVGENPAPVYLVFGRYKEWAYYAGDWSHRDVLQQRIDRAYACLREAQVGYVSGFNASVAGCQLDFPALGIGREEIIGSPPPSETSGPIADAHWASDEAMKISVRRDPEIWLFLPDAAAHFIDGFPLRRHLLEKLELDMRSDGCRKVEVYYQAETLAHKFDCAL